MSKNSVKTVKKRKVFRLGITIVIVIMLLVIVFPKINEQINRNRIVKSLQYDAIEADGKKYYPTTIPVIWVPSSLPPTGSQTVYKVVNGMTDYNHEYKAETFYNEDFLYFDEFVFYVEKGLSVLEILLY